MKLSVFAFTLLVVFIGCCSSEEQDHNGAQTVDEIILQPAKHPKLSSVMKKETKMIMKRNRVVCPDGSSYCQYKFHLL